MFPAEIVADRAAGTIAVVWDDGHQSLYGAELLRWSCPCATCAGEMGRPGILAGLERLPPDEFRLTDVRAVGTYGITPVWASGHATGIYAFDYLRDLCPCPLCAATRESPS